MIKFILKATQFHLNSIKTSRHQDLSRLQVATEAPIRPGKVNTNWITGKKRVKFTVPWAHTMTLWIRNQTPRLKKHEKKQPAMGP